MTTINKITDILFIVLTIIYILILIITAIINFEDLFNPKKYYKIEYIFDNKGKSETVIKAKTPEKAIRKLIHKFERSFPLNELTDIINCKEIDYYKCLKEVEKDE